MDTAVKEKWVNALRSEDYKQGKGVLCRKGEEFCCLGVLTDIYIKENNLAWEPAGMDADYLAFEGEAFGLTQSVVDWAGLEESHFGKKLDEPIEGVDTYYCEDCDEKHNSHDSLIGLNDSAGFSFSQIADVIEAQF
jgi:hypothetical protein